MKSYIILSTFAFISVVFLPINTRAQIIAPKPYVNTNKPNYLRIWQADAPEQDANVLMTRPLRDVKQTTQYFDGLGRPVQTVIKQGSLPTGASPVDLVVPFLYDEFGREQYKYLPFAANNTGGNFSVNDGLFKLNPFQQDSAFYKNLFPAETFIYSQTKFELSPLNRVIEAYAQGNSWAGSANQPIEANRHGVDVRYSVNTANDNVQKWTVTNNPSGGFGSYAAVSYPPGVLTKMITEDEHGGQTLEFKDKAERLVLKKVLLTQNRDMGAGSNGHDGWLNTYYIYDDLGNLRCVIQPQGERLMWVQGVGAVLNTPLLNEQCFRYEYDARNRVILKQVPGGGMTEMVYDKRDRLIMSRDSSLRKQNFWLINKYDELNRLAKIGLVYNTSSRVFHQGAADNDLTFTYPTLNAADVMQENYYDDYSWITPTPQNGISSTLNNPDYYSAFFIMNFDQAPDYAQPVVADYVNVRGKPTGSKVRIFGTSTYLHSVIFYDEKGRVIQTRGANITGGYDMHTTQYDHSGKPLRIVHRHNKNPPNAIFMKVLTSYTYDDLGRTTILKKKVGGSAANERVIAQNEYDALGRLKTKEVGVNLETQTYDYNVRGWLLGVNRASLTKGTQPTSKFSYELAYDNITPTITPGSYGTAQYNGNIAGMMWRSIGDWENRKYNFKYDAAGRLLKADFTQFSNANNQFDLSANIDYSVTMGNGIHPDSAYDVNGNIKRMQQKGFKINNSLLIDDLSYSYMANSNKLLKVTDGMNDPNSKMGDFKENVSGTNDYTYDGNGNLISDNNKGISTILYNHLNTPYEIRIPGKGKILYTYDNLGTKLKKVVYDSTGTQPTTNTWIYVHNMVYKNDTLEFFTYEEGRARRDTSEHTAEAIKFDYDYFIKDHLGNVRMVLTEQKDTAAYWPLSFEGATGSNDQIMQDKIWENKSGNSINVVSSRIARPGAFGTSTTNGSYAMLMRKSMGAIGAAKLLKVMSGDRIHTQVEYYYSTTNANNSGANSINSLLANLATAMVSSEQVSGFLKDGASALTSSLSSNTSFVNWLNTPNAISGTNNAPKAYLNILFFDEQFKPDNVATTVIPVAYLPNGKGTINKMFANALTARQNGYVYVYFSNESDEMVYFDNFMLTHELGSLREETHYYPFGLTMAGISSKAIGKVENKNRFNGIEQTTELDLNQYDAFFRTMDPQIGRWWQIDPKPNLSMSGYSSMDNNPLLRTDFLGDTAIIFGKDGRFLRFEDDGKKAFSGRIITGSSTKVSVDANGNTTVTTKVKYSKFSLNDGNLVAQAVRNGVINKVEMVSESKIQRQIERSGVRSEAARAHPLSYAREQGVGGGAMDYAVRGFDAGDLNQNTLYVTGGVGYDIADFGNFLWGRGMAELGIALPTAHFGAQFNHIWNNRILRNDGIPLFDLGKDTYDPNNPGWWDSNSDQRAISNGYSSNPSVIKAQQEIKRRINNYMQNWKPYQN